MSRRSRRRHPRSDTPDQFVETDKQGHELPDPTPAKFVTSEGEPGGVGGTSIPIPDEDLPVVRFALRHGFAWDPLTDEEKDHWRDVFAKDAERQAVIPDEEIEAEEAANQARIAEEDQALAEVDAEAGVQTDPALAAESLNDGFDPSIEFTPSPFSGAQGWKATRGSVQAVALTKERAVSMLLRIEGHKTEKVSMPLEEREAFDRSLDEVDLGEDPDLDYDSVPGFTTRVEPPFDPEIFERGPLAAGIRMLEALLTQAKAGYINDQVEELERVLEESFDEAERFFLGNVASQEVTASGLPDVAGAYKALIRAKAQVAA